MTAPAISHITLGANNPARAAEFYDAVLGAINFQRIPKPGDKPACYARGGTFPYIYIYLPENGLPATWGNGTHVAFGAETRGEVDVFYKTALALGGTDAGAPGLRPHYGENYYAAYVRDLDGNKLQAVCYGG